MQAEDLNQRFQLAGLEVVGTDWLMPLIKTIFSVEERGRDDEGSADNDDDEGRG